MLAPIRWRKRIGFHALLLGERVLEQGEDPVYFGEVLVLGLLNRCLRKIVPQHILGVHTIHTPTPFIVMVAFMPQSIPVAHRPLVETVTVEEMFAQLFIGCAVSR